MQEVIRNFPQQFVQGVTANSFRVAKKYARIITCGMGGSAIPGEILSLVSDNVVVHWDYDLPANANSNDLVICTSWSGSTEETISSYEKALALDLDVIAITKGAKLAQLAQAADKPLVLLPQENIQPRTAVGYMTGALFAVLDRENELPNNLDSGQLEKQGQELASKIAAMTPLIYASYPGRKLAGLWKAMLNENAKIHAFANSLPSAAHNEIVGFTDPAGLDCFAVLVLQDPKEDPRHQRNLDALLALLKDMRYNVFTIELVGNSLLEKIFNNYLLALWTSFFIAQKNGVDPVDTTLIEKFKELKKN